LFGHDEPVTPLALSNVIPRRAPTFTSGSNEEIQMSFEDTDLTVLWRR
jgi:hypothetical protein